MRVEDSSPIVTNRGSNPDYSLDDNGELLEFLNLDGLSSQGLGHLICVFVETMELVTTHSGKASTASSPLLHWTQDVKKAWVKFLKIFYVHLIPDCP